MKKYSINNAEQPMSIENDLPAIPQLVMADVLERMYVGIEKYGHPLQPHNGRDPLIDAYQEAMDLCIYLRQMIYEKYGA